MKGELSHIVCSLLVLALLLTKKLENKTIRFA